MRKLIAVAFALSALTGFAQAQNTDSSPMDHSKMDHAAHMKGKADAQRQAEVSERGKDVMPFSLSATTHIFTKNADGGVQRVVAKDASDADQVARIRQHLREIQAQFLQGDFAGPSHIHGQDMPGLAELKAASSRQIDIAYQDVEGGAQLTYTAKEVHLADALHKWFDAQLSDHGSDAVEGHESH
ncbi:MULTISPECIES: aspartate carbamoyltransferase [Achromobacter]|uniref:Aspartate carbamoyltransferase n=1 Tax=Achromobacter spanius TaxID=217203 RepID=A0ABY8GVC1_9BURK|nr:MULTISPECIES: aspartate carbamoyltransferase [Achromobacter]WAI82278.1 aspartate carbamoyltransferase [Achromobacter spanius]WEX92366.1 aspartate carbamoyltransferase [Achromobacter sp. SS2-2022]WFP08483.1 aspartate carbamoyltransferase [Achromobacter spanius]